MSNEVLVLVGIVTGVVAFTAVIVVAGLRAVRKRREALAETAALMGFSFLNRAGRGRGPPLYPSTAGPAVTRTFSMRAVVAAMTSNTRPPASKRSPAAGTRPAMSSSSPATEV